MHVRHEIDVKNEIHSALNYYSTMQHSSVFNTQITLDGLSVLERNEKDFSPLKDAFKIILHCILSDSLI